MRQVRIMLLAAIVVFAAGLVRAEGLSSADRSALQKAIRLSEKGMEQFRRGDLEGAREALTQAVRAFPDLPDAHMGLGHVAMNRKDYAAALTEYQQARAVFETAGQRLFDLKQERYMATKEQVRRLNDELRDISASETQFDRAPTDSATSRYRTSAQSLKVRETQIRDQIRDLERITQPSPEEAHEAPGLVHFYIGNAHFHLSHVAEAVTSWETCVARDPGFDPVYNNLAVGYLRLGRPAQARTALDEAIKRGVAVPPGLVHDIDRALAAAGGQPPTAAPAPGSQH